MMFPICLSIVGLTVIGLLTLTRAVFTAPHGEEDENGFRVVSPSKGEVAEAPIEATGVLPDLAFFHR